MKVIEKVLNSELIKEYQSNKRLQWMVVGIAAVLVVSLCKQISVSLGSQRDATKNQLRLLSKLISTANQEFNAKELLVLESNVESALSSIKTVASASTAEAQALQDIEQKIGKYISRKRLKLIGSDEVLAGNHVFWSVRIEIAGQLNEKDFIQVLHFFDTTKEDARISSMQYSPKTSNTITLVVDLMYKRGSND